MVVSALAAWRERRPGEAGLDSAIRRGIAFLLRGRGASGWWLSTQSTVRAMRAIADAFPVMGSEERRGGVLEVRSAGRLVKTVTLPGGVTATDPILVDLSSHLAAGVNSFSLSAGGALARLTVSHWLPWGQATPRTSPEFRFTVTYDRLEGNAGEPVRCTVKAERVGFRGHGMMLAEIGLPPGAEVDRASLEAVLDGRAGLDHYEILPDRVVLYLWPSAGGSVFEFFLTPRNRMDAQSGASILYDYYNAEALVEVAPFRWRMR